MNVQDNSDRQIASWLAEGPHRLPEAAIDRILVDIEQSDTRKLTWLRRRETMNRPNVAAGSLAAVALTVVIGIGLLSGGGGFGFGPGPTASPTPSPTATATPTATARPTSTAEAGLPQGPFDLSRPRPGSDVIPMTVTIPASGWVQLVDFNFLRKGNGVDLAEALVMPMAYPAGTGFYVPGDPCRSTSTRPDTPVTTVDDLVAALAAQASRDASEPVDVMVGGYEGKSVTLHVPDDAPFDRATFDGCEDSSFISYDTEQSGNLWHHRPGQIDDLWIVDVDGVIVVIDAEYGPDTPAELVEEMRTLAQSVTFGTP
jgi:hypothetical protein